MKKNNGFTMIELLAVLVILGIITLIAVPAISRMISKTDKDYYPSLEGMISSYGQDYFNDRRTLLPKETGNIKTVAIKLLVNQKYGDEPKDINGKTCGGSVLVQKKATGKYEYTACLECKDYKSKEAVCGYTEDNNDKVVISGVGNTVIKQGSNYTIPKAKVTINGEVIADVSPNPPSIDTNQLTTYDVFYTYKNASKNIKYKVTDQTAPAKPVVSLKHPDGSVYNENWTNKNVVQTITSDDWTKVGVMGSGIKSFLVSIDNQRTWKEYESPSGILTMTETASANRTVYVKTIDQAGNTSSVTSYVLKIDRSIPTVPVLSGGGNSWTSTNRNIRVISSSTATSGIKNYQYYISTSSGTQTGGNWINLSSGVTNVVVSTNGTYYVYMRAIGNTGSIGQISLPQTVKVDSSNPTVPVLAGGSNTWYNSGSRTVSISTKSFAISGIKNYEYKISYYDASGNYTSGAWAALSGDTTVTTISNEGNYYIYVRALSNSGKYSSSSSAANVRIDKSAPVLTNYTLKGESATVNSWDDTGYPNRTVDISAYCLSYQEECKYMPFKTAQVSDKLSGFSHSRLYVDGILMATSTYNSYITIQREKMDSKAGKYVTYELYYVDNAGNEKKVFTQRRLYYLSISFGLASDNATNKMNSIWWIIDKNKELIYPAEPTNTSGCKITEYFYVKSPTATYKTNPNLQRLNQYTAVNIPIAQNPHIPYAAYDCNGFIVKDGVVDMTK